MLPTLSEKLPRITASNAQTPDVIEHNIDALLGQIGSPTIPRSINVKLQMGQRNSVVGRDHIGRRLRGGCGAEH
jgi:hypothetical protein